VCAAALQQGHHVTYYNLGIRRDTSADIAARWHAECARRFPQDTDGRVVFSFGVNDTTIEHGRRRLSCAATLGNLRTILQDARQRSPTLLIGPPPVADATHNTRIAHLCNAMAMVARDIGVPYLPVFAQLIQAPRWMQEVVRYDGSHPRQAGYAELAALVQAWSAWWFADRP
jgi:lysophospholipase L1-like esterase